MRTRGLTGLVLFLPVVAVLTCGVAAAAFAGSSVKVNGYEIDLQAQEPAVPAEPEPVGAVQGKKQIIPLDAVQRTYLKQFAKGKGGKTAVPRSGPRPEDRKYKKWIVRFAGPVHEEQKKALLDLGCRIGDYLPDFAFIVTMDDNTKKRAEKLSFISGIARFKPAYKIHKLLRDESGAVRAEKGKKARLIIRVDDARNMPVLLSEVHRNKGVVLDVRNDAARVEIDESHIAPLAQVEEVLWIGEAGDLKLLNDTSRWTIQTYELNNTKIGDKGLHGEGQIVGIGDTGLDYDMPWFHDPSGAPIGPSHRKVAGYTPFMDDYDGNFGHGTHVAGSVAGDRTPVDGLSNANGMAPKARLFMQDITPGEEYYVYPPADLGEMFITTYYAGARLHTNSWGGGANTYDSLTRSADQFMWEHKDFLVLFANGNSGPGEGSVGYPATAKNIVSVGATENGSAAENVAGFSSNGAAFDGRIKPTITAPGVAIVSADSDGIKNSFNSGTVAYSGTSMATPTAAGAAALIRQYYESGYWPSGTANPADGFNPSAALVKATLVNSGQNMAGQYADAPIPSTGQGWGRINLSNTLYFAGDARFLDVSDVTTGLATGASWSKNYFSSGDQFLKVTLVWTDYPGAEGAATALVNDLDLAVTAPNGTTTYLGNVFQNGASLSGGSADRLNVEEQVLIPTVEPGNYAVTVTGYNVPYGPQPFAVVVTGAVSISSKGFVGLDRTRYNAASTIMISVGDADLNVNPAAADEVTITISSAEEPAGETVQLVETGPDTAMFFGSVPTGPGPAAPGNGILEVAEGNAITAAYQDADDGTGSPAVVTAAALADLTPPVITGVSTGAVGQDSAVVSWTTNEQATGTVNYGETTGLGASQSVSWRTTSPALALGNLQENTTYYYKVVSTDEAGNAAVDDNGGSLYTFTTLNLPPDLTVNSSNYTETYQTESVIYGIATDPSGVVSVTVNGQAASYRASDGYYELTVPLVLGENLFTVTATDGLGNVKTLTITVTRFEMPDLVMTSVVNPAQGGWWEPVHADFTFCNIGAGAAPWSGWIGFYVSTDNVISQSEDRDLYQYWGFEGPILPGECISWPADLMLSVPISYTGNTYYLGAFADAEHDIWESDEMNNGLAGSQMTIEGPDLAMTEVAGPATALTETGFIVSNTVVNSGIGYGYQFDVGIYLSTDPVITTSDIRIGHRMVGGLRPPGSSLPGESESSDDTLVTIPATVPAGTYYIGAIADFSNSRVESNETNNALPGNQVTVTGPDVIMTSVSGPASGQTGSAITISSTVSADAGGGAAAGINVAFYLSTDTVITTSDIYIGARHIETLAPGASSTADTVVAIPTTFPGGTFSIGAIADPNNTVVESDETNNAAAGNQITVTGPDLIMTAVSRPVSGLTGGTATVSTTVAASATGAATREFYVGVFLSADNVITTSDTLLGYRHVPGLAPGASSTADLAVTIPGNIVPGTYYIGAIADNFPVWIGDEGGYEVYDNVKESDETNNALAGNQITVTGGDLVMTEVSGPADGLTGKTIEVHNTVTAVGGGAGWFSVGFYLSSDSVITTTDRYLSRRDISALAPDASSTADTTLTIPGNLAPGTYYLGAIADYSNRVQESNETNNGLAGNAITVTGSDLVMNAVSGPSSVLTGAAITVSTTVSAADTGGNAPVFSIGIYLSTDSVITTSDNRIGTRYLPSLAAGASSTADTTITLPGNAGHGTYYLGAIADYSNQVQESDETNNALAGNQITVTGPDLAMTAVSGPASGQAGGTITVSNTVIADADGGTPPNFHVGFYLSSDAVITTSDRYIGNRYVTGLAPGASSAADTVITIPATVPGATYYIGAIADFGNAAPESDETNNSLAGNQIEVAGPDLTMAAVSGPAESVRGATITVNDTVTNIGGLGSSHFYVGIYLSADAAITESDMLLEYRYVPGLAPGASSEAATSVTIPSYTAPGTYYIGAIADNFAIWECDEWDCWDTGMSNRITESNEANNALAGNQIVVTLP